MSVNIFVLDSGSISLFKTPVKANLNKRNLESHIWDRIGRKTQFIK